MAIQIRTIGYSIQVSGWIRTIGHSQCGLHERRPCRLISSMKALEREDLATG
jgi:hypothetical protein